MIICVKMQLIFNVAGMFYVSMVEKSERNGTYCLPAIQKAINTQGGLSDESLVPAEVYPKTE